MAHKNYSSEGGGNWVTIGGFNRAGQANPKTITGYYLGRFEGPNQFEPGKTKVAYVLSVKGVKTFVNNSANLNIKMESAERGIQAEGDTAANAEVTITYTGTQPSKKGTPTKLYDVTFDLDNRLNAAAANDLLEDADADGDDESDDLDEVLGEGQGRYDDEAPRVSAAKKSSAAEILGRRNASRK